jgi:peptide/nickel transport system ATP-binding protein
VRTIGSQFAEHLNRLGRPSGSVRAETLAALASVNLPDPPALIGRYPHQISGGQAQRVLIALAFSSKPALVVADEPTTALDVTTQVHVLAELKRLQAAHGTAVLFVTHDLRLATHLCDRITVLYAGTVVESGPARAVFRQPVHPYTRALAAATPRLSGPRVMLAALPDTMPSLADYPDLPPCRFQPRCPYGAPPPASGGSCGEALGWHDLGEGRGVRARGVCITSTEAADTTPLPAPPPPGPVILRVEGLAKTFRAPRQLFGQAPAPVQALAPFDLNLRAGEFLGVVGESGSGKSTLARLLVGLERPTAGRILLDGKHVAGLSLAERVAALQLVFQDPRSALNPRRTVAELVTQPMEPAARPWAERLTRLSGLLAATGLDAGIAGRYPNELSGGQRQRVNIARALCATPRVLIADEIVSGLDVSVQAQILAVLQDLRRESGIALIFISHDLAVVRHLCDRVIVLHQGVVQDAGATDAVFERPTAAYTRRLLASVPPDQADAEWRDLTHS